MDIEKKIDNYLINEGKDYNYDTNLMDNLANLIENNYKKKYPSWERLVKKEIIKAKKTLKLNPKHWKQQLSEVIDNLEVVYEEELYEDDGDEEKGEMVRFVIDTIEEHM